VNQDRRTQLESSLREVRDRIAAACAAAGRPVGDVALIAVTKGFPAHDVALLAELGVTDVGESRDQEAKAKIAELTGLGEPADLASVRWHLIGQLQTNKARSVVRYAAMVHTVDRRPLADALGKAAISAQRPPLEVLAQVSLDGDPNRGGADEDQLPGLLESISEHPGLRLRGLMAVAPREGEPASHFAHAADILVRQQARFEGLNVLSAGMSGDFEAAIAHGATHVRVGTALLGYRAPLLG
jgi:pyridoxal phosphate enzyme (YggS family)